MTRARLLEIERLREDAKVGLAQLSLEEVWALVAELLPEAELAGIIDRGEPGRWVRS